MAPGAIQFDEDAVHHLRSHEATASGSDAHGIVRQTLQLETCLKGHSL